MWMVVVPVLKRNESDINRSLCQQRAGMWSTAAWTPTTKRRTCGSSGSTSRFERMSLSGDNTGPQIPLCMWVVD